MGRPENCQDCVQAVLFTLPSPYGLLAGYAHTNVFDLENQSECELLIKILASLQCSKRCQFNNCFVFFCHGERNNSHETFAKGVWVIVECRVSRLGGRGRGFEVEVEVKKSRSRLKSRDRG